MTSKEVSKNLFPASWPARRDEKQIGILGVPIGLGAGRVGPEGGDRTVRMAHLRGALEALGYRVQDHGSMAVPRPADPGDLRIKYLPEIARVCRDVAGWVEQRLASGTMPVVLGGDHSLTVGSVSGVASHLHRQGKRLGLIWIDAHADMNTPETSPSGNIHGMALASLLGYGDEALTELCGFAPKVSARNAVLVGIRDIDQTEQQMLARSGVRTFTIRDIDERGMFSVMHEAIEHASHGTAGIHVSLDMDALDPTAAPGVGTPVPGGLTYREAHLALEMIADTENLVSMDVVEVNPMLDAQDLTARMAVGLIASALGKRILARKVFSDR